MESSGADVGYAVNWSSSGGAPVTATNGGVTVSLPERATGVVTLSEGGVSIGMGIPYGAGASNAVEIGDASTLYTGGTSNVAVIAQADSTGAREAVTISSSNAPTSYSFPLTIPTGASLVSNADGSYTIEGQSTVGGVSQNIYFATIAAPWAKDANGNPVATSYSLLGNTLTQTVDFTSATAFPVVADPTIGYSNEDAWGTYTWVWTRDGTAAFQANIDNAGGGILTVTAICAYFAKFVPEVSPEVIFGCSLIGIVIGSSLANTVSDASAANHCFELQYNIIGGLASLSYTNDGTFMCYTN
jgi:hypothetical protein